MAELIGENVVSSEKYSELQKKHLKVKSDYQRVLDQKLEREIRFIELTQVRDSTSRVFASMLIW